MATQADFDRIGNYARMYNPDQNIDRRRSHRTVPMQVICPGYSRTGTLSMQKALTILGYPNVYHFSSFYDNVQDCDYWLDLINAKFEGKGTYSPEDFDRLLGHCGAVTDMPCHLFASEMIEYYAAAKVVLVERDIESWFASWSHFLDSAMSPVFPILGKLEPWRVGRIIAVGIAGTDKQVGSGRTKAAAKARSKEEYRKHYALVRAVTPKERLLEFSLKDGWAPLCEFLGKEVPDQPFPHLNDTTANAQGFKELGIMGVRSIIKRAVILGGVVAVPILAWWMSSSGRA